MSTPMAAVAEEAEVVVAAAAAVLVEALRVAWWRSFSGAIGMTVRAISAPVVSPLPASTPTDWRWSEWVRKGRRAAILQLAALGLRCLWAMEAILSFD